MAVGRDAQRLGLFVVASFLGTHQRPPFLHAKPVHRRLLVGSGPGWVAKRSSVDLGTSCRLRPRID